jgi:hypothetical protein
LGVGKKQKKQKEKVGRFERERERGKTISHWRSYQRGSLAVIVYVLYSTVRYGILYGRVGYTIL